MHKTLVMHWDGSRWGTVPSPNRSRFDFDALTSVAAISPSDVWAVGLYRSQTGYRTLTEHYDGVRWSYAPSPSGHHYTVLSDVTALSSDDVWAVGAITQHDGQWYRGLFEHWDGQSWSIVDSDLPRHRTGGTAAVSAVGPDDVWAASDTGALYHYNGAWRYGDPPASGLTDISMAARDDGWAVGGNIIQHWDGQSWQIASSPGWTERALDAYSRSDVWAVGPTEFLEHWDGKTWSSISRPGPADLWDVEVVAPDDAWAVGSWEGAVRIEHWDGSKWAITV